MSDKQGIEQPSLTCEKPPSDSPQADNEKGESNSIEVLDAASDKKLTRRLDRRVIPPLFVLFLMSFLDRSNIGNAKIQGLEASLNMSGQDYSIALFVFFVTYILCEVPSNLILKKMAPSTWLSFIVVCWGKTTPQTCPRLLRMHR